jgi:hypothetical protein
MGLAVAGTQTIHRDMGVKLRSRERSVTKQLLYATKVRAAVQKMRGRTVSQAVRTQRRHSLDSLQGQMHHLPDLSLVNSTTTTAEKRCRRGIFPNQLCSSSHQPGLKCSSSGQAIRDDPLLAPLAENPYRAPTVVQVIDIQTAKFTHSDAGGVEQFEHCGIPQRRRVHIDDVGPGAGFGQCVSSLLRLEYLGQRTTPLRRHQPEPDIGADPAGAVEPGSERARAGRPAGQRRPGLSLARHRGQPGTKDQQIEPGLQLRRQSRRSASDIGAPRRARGWCRAGRCGFGSDVPEQVRDVAQIGAHGVNGESALRGQIALETRHHRIQGRTDAEPVRVVGRFRLLPRRILTSGNRGHTPTVHPRTAALKHPARVASHRHLGEDPPSHPSVRRNRPVAHPE